MKCVKCGNEIPNGSLNCPICGPGVNNQNNTPQQFNNGMQYSNQNNMNTMNNNFNNMGNNSNPFMNNVPKKNNNLLIIIGIVVLIGIIVAAIFMFKSPSKDNKTNNTNNANNNQQENQNGTQSTNTTVTSDGNIIKLKNGDYLIAYKNDSNDYVEVACQAEFYKGSQVVGSEYVIFPSYVAPHKTGYGQIHASLHDLDFDKIVPKMDAGKFNYNAYDDKIAHTEIKSGEWLVVRLTNNSGVELDDLGVIVLYYDNQNRIIGYDDEDFHKVANGKTEEAELDLPEDEDFNVLSYSRYEIIIVAND